MSKLHELLNTNRKTNFHQINGLEETYKIEGVPVFVETDKKGNFLFTHVSEDGRKEKLIIEKDSDNEKIEKAFEFWDSDSQANADYVDAYQLVSETIKNSDFRISSVTLPENEFSRNEKILATNERNSSLSFSKVGNEYIIGYKNSLGFEKNYSVEANDEFASEKIKNIFVLERICDGFEVHLGKSEYSLSDDLADYPMIQNAKLTKTNNGYLVEKINERKEVISSKSFVTIEKALFSVGAIDSNAYLQKIVDKAEESKLFIESSYLYKQYSSIKDWVVEKPDALNEMLAELKKADTILETYNKISELESKQGNIIFEAEYDEILPELTVISKANCTSGESARDLISLTVKDEEKINVIVNAYEKIIAKEKENKAKIESLKEKIILSETLGEGKTLETKEVVIKKTADNSFELNLIAKDEEGKEYVLTPIERTGIIQISDSRDLEGLHYSLTPEKIEVENHEFLDTVIVRNFVDVNGRPDIEFASDTITVRQSDRSIKWSEEIEGFVKDAEKVYDSLEAKDVKETPEVVSEPVVEEVETAEPEQEDTKKYNEEENIPSPQEVEEQVQLAEALADVEESESESELLDIDMGDDYYSDSYIPDDDCFDSVE